MIAGLTKDLTAKMTLMVGGTSMTQTAILAQLATIQALFANATAAKNASVAAVNAKNAGIQAAKQFMTSLTKAVEMQFGENNPQLTDFGLTLPKAKAVRTAAEKAASSGLALQTRAVRGTMGKKQKLDVTVTGKPGVVIVGPTGVPLAGVSQGAPIAPAPLPAAGGSTSAASSASDGSTPAVASTGVAGK
jgi:ATP-dependent protease HslVU (ClpYQ) ATPase subunit